MGRSGISGYVVACVVDGCCGYAIVEGRFSSVCGMLCGAMANPMALNYANESVDGDHASVAYATVYPLSMFARVLLAQVVLMVFM